MDKNQSTDQRAYRRRRTWVIAFLLFLSTSAASFGVYLNRPMLIASSETAGEAWRVDPTPSVEPALASETVESIEDGLSSSGTAGMDLSDVGANGFERVFTQGIGALVETPESIELDEWFGTSSQKRVSFRQIEFAQSSKRAYQCAGPLSGGPTGFKAELVPIPNLTELTVREAQHRIESFDFKTKIPSSAEDSDLVLVSQPSQGVAPYRSTIVIRSVGVRVPDVLSLPMGRAEEEIKLARLQPNWDKSVRQHHPVTHMEPAPGSIVEKFSDIVFYSMTTTPNILGEGESYAVETLQNEDLGITPVAPARLSDDVVCGQYPRGGIPIKRGQFVKIEMGPIMPNLVGMSVTVADSRLRAKIIDGKIVSRNYRITRTTINRVSLSPPTSTEDQVLVSLQNHAAWELDPPKLPTDQAASKSSEGDKTLCQAIIEPNTGGGFGGAGNPASPPVRTSVRYQLLDSVVSGQGVRAGIPLTRRKPVAIEITDNYLQIVTQTIPQPRTGGTQGFGGNGLGGGGGAGGAAGGGGGMF